MILTRIIITGIIIALFQKPTVKLKIAKANMMALTVFERNKVNELLLTLANLFASKKILKKNVQ